MSQCFTKKSDEMQYNEALQACERQEMKVFTPNRSNIFTQTTYEH